MKLTMQAGFFVFAAVWLMDINIVRMLTMGTGTLVVSVVMFCVYLIFCQEKVLYIPDINGIKTPADNPSYCRTPSGADLKYEDAKLRSGSDVVHCWFIPAPAKPSTAPTLVFCHENAGNMGLRMQEFVYIHQRLRVNLLAFDYRGYGFSTGTPSQEGLIMDTEAVLTYLATKAGNGEIDGSKVFLYGRSLGGAVVIHVAAKGNDKKEALALKVAGVIVENSFTSIADMLDSVFPYIAFDFVKKFFLRLEWKSIDKIGCITQPILLLSGLQDEIVPPSHMARLKEGISNAEFSEMHTFELGSHNDTWHPERGGDRYWAVQEKFIARCTGPATELERSPSPNKDQHI